MFVNDFQKDEFERYGVSRRDPMFITVCATLLSLPPFWLFDPNFCLSQCAALMELEGFPTSEALIRLARSTIAPIEAVL